MSLLNKISSSVYIIAEMSANHAGKLENALKIVHAAKAAGADCLKIQTYTADTMTIDCDNEYFQIHGGLWNGYKLYKLYAEAATPWEWQIDIKSECDKIGIDFLSTPFDKTSADFLEGLGVEAYKIASFELVDIPLLRHVAKKHKPMIVSCGMGSVEEIQDAVTAMLEEGLTREQIVLLKCTSEYPANIADMNLATITDLQNRFGTKVGLSDHSIGTLAPIAAVALGASVIEKHFCLSRKLRNPDSDFSTEPQEFADMVAAVNQTRLVCGKVSYKLSEAEKASTAFRRSIFAVRDIAEGESFTDENIRIIRPGCGMLPKYYSNMLGTKSQKSYKAGTPLNEVVP